MRVLSSAVVRAAGFFAPEVSCSLRSRPAVFQVGERLGRFEVEKRCAVEKEDYDLAKEKKQQMERYRGRAYARLQLHGLLDAELVGTQGQAPRARCPELGVRRVASARLGHGLWGRGRGPQAPGSSVCRAHRTHSVLVSAHAVPGRVSPGPPAR